MSSPGTRAASNLAARLFGINPLYTPLFLPFAATPSRTNSYAAALRSTSIIWVSSAALFDCAINGRKAAKLRVQVEEVQQWLGHPRPTYPQRRTIEGSEPR